MIAPPSVEAAQSEHANEGVAPAAAKPIAAKPRTEASPRFAAHWRIAAIAAVALAAAVPLVGTWHATATSPRLGPDVSVTPVTSYPGEESDPALAPDATRVAFSWDGETGNHDIYVTQIGTSTRLRLTASTEGADRYPAWSPNGEQIAFLRERDASQFDVLVMPALGGTERVLYTGQRNWISRDGFPLLTWTPDSRQLVFTTRHSGTDDAPTYGLHRLSVATGEIEPLDIAGSRENYDTSPAISADGTWLAFARYHRSERLNQVMVQRLGPGFKPRGEPQTVPGLDPGIYHSLFWNQAGDRLCFVRGGQILEWSVGGAARVVYTAGPQFSMNVAAMAPSGATLRAAVVDRRGKPEIFALPLNPLTHEAAGPPMVRVPSTAVDQHPRFSPDGERLAFVSDRTGTRALWLAAADGSDPQRITDLDQLITGYPRWSPDGTRIAFHTSAPGEARVIWLVDVEKRGPATRLLNGCCPGGWSADGEYLYVGADAGTNRGFVSRVNVATRSQELLFEGETAVESSDGRYLLYAKSRERGYFRRSLDGHPAESEEQRLVTDYRPPIGGIAPVADGFFYIGLGSNDEPRAVRFFDYARGEPRDIALVPVGTVVGLTLSPDGRELLYAAVDGPPEADIVLLEFAAERGTSYGPAERPRPLLIRTRSRSGRSAGPGRKAVRSPIVGSPLASEN